MRASTARLAMVVFLSISICGCQSGGGMFAWFSRKKPSETAVANGPAVSPGTPTYPTVGQNPANSLNTVSSTNSWANGAAGAKPSATATAGPSYGATPAAYQNPAYPSTGYGQAKIGPTAGTTPNWSAGTTNPSPAVGYAANATPAGYGAASGATAWPNNSAATATTVAASPAYASGATGNGYGANPAASPAGVQPQAGFYNPTYDGGTANRYATGGAIPGTNPSAVAGSAYPAMASPAGTAPSYRVADARGAADPSAAAASTLVGDRYANSTPAAAVTTTPDRYSAPPADYRSSPTGYDPGNTGYQPGGTASPVGNTGYGAPASYSPATSDSSSGMPTRTEPNYRPGGTSNYVSPAGGSVQPGANSQPDNRAGSLGVTPASFQSASAGRATLTGGVAATSAGSQPSGEVYGSYQGSPAASDTAAAGAANPSGTTPALLPNRSW